MLIQKIEFQMKKGNYICVCMYVFIIFDLCDILYNSIYVGDIKNVKNEICIDYYNYFLQDLIYFIVMNVICIYLLQFQGKRMQKGSKDVWVDFKEKVSFSVEIQKYMFKQ